MKGPIAMTDAITDTEWPTSMQQKRNERLNDPRSRAIDTLTRAGRSAEVTEVIDRMTARAQSTYKTIESDNSRSEEWKAQETAAKYAGFKTMLTDELVSLARSAEGDDQRDASMVFGTGGLPGDAGSLAISSRDAADRVYSTPSEDLRDLLARATRIGDEVLARAVVKRAIEEGYPDIVNDFTADRPDLYAATERLWERERRGDRRGIGPAMRTIGIAPMRARR